MSSELILCWAIAVFSLLVATRDRITHRQALLIGIMTPFVIEAALWLLRI